MSKSVSCAATSAARASLTTRCSVTLQSGALKLVDSHHVRISRIGEVKTYESTRKLYRHLERGTGRVVSATFSEVNAKFFISFTLEVTRSIPATRSPERVIGIDVGLTALYTGATAVGEHALNVANPRHFVTAEKKLPTPNALPLDVKGRAPVRPPPSAGRRPTPASSRFTPTCAMLART